MTESRDSSFNARMTDYYEKRSAEYEQIYYRDNPERRQEIDDEAHRLRDLARDHDVLDIACGTGYWTTRLSDTARSITAIDRSMGMLTEARRKQYRCPISFLKADLNRMPFADSAFTLTCLGFWFSHHPRQEFDRLFEVIISLTRPGGRIWMVDNNPPAEGPTLESIGKDEHGNNFKRRFLDNGAEYVILKNYFDQDELSNIFSRRFRIDRLTYNRYYWAVVLDPK